MREIYSAYKTLSNRAMTQATIRVKIIIALADFIRVIFYKCAIATRRHCAKVVGRACAVSAAPLLLISLGGDICPHP